MVYNNGGHYDNTTGRFTAPFSGYYHVGVQHMNENNATYDNKYYEVRKNGAMFKRAYGSSGSNVHHQFVWHGVIYLNASDYVHVYNHNLTIYATGESHSYFSGYLIG